MRAAYIIVALAAAAVSCSPTGDHETLRVGLIHFETSISSVDVQSEPMPVSLTLCTADSAYSNTWSDISDFPENETCLTGRYHALAVAGTMGAEGRDCPCYAAYKEFEVVAGERTNVLLDCHLTQAMVRPAFGSLAGDGYTLTETIFHSSGHSYISCVPSSSGDLLFLSPGETYTFVTVAESSGESVTLAPDFSVATKADCMYRMKIGIEDGALIIDNGDARSVTPLTPELFSTEAPQITCHGFSNGVGIGIVEGERLPDGITMGVSAQAGIQSLILTVEYKSGGRRQMYSEYDICDPDCPLYGYGLRLDRESDTEATVDFSELLETFGVNTDTYVRAMLVARDRLGRVSEAAELEVGIESLDLELVSVSPAVIGYDTVTAVIRVNAGSYDRYDFSVTTQVGTESRVLPVENSYINADGTLSLRFAVPEGITDLPVTICYLDNPKLDLVVGRVVPEFAVEYDVFATYALAHVTASSPKAASAVTRYVSVTSDGSDRRVSQRDAEACAFRVDGLTPGRRMDLRAYVTADGYSLTSSVTTEQTEQIPDSDLEDSDVLIDYKDLPCGGSYSSTVFPIFNQQNTVHVKVTWPKRYWASVNAKTFCTSARTMNTWYTMPSSANDLSASVAGTKSIRMTSVGWSVQGGEITPSVQQEGSYIPYNPNIPHVAHVAAGRLFLGSYSYDAMTNTEKYTEGVKFTSRPSSFNGFYKYVTDKTDHSDRGYVRVELVSDTPRGTVVVASGDMEFDPAPDFRTFNLPLRYDVYNLKPTRIQVMFASSSRIGTIEYEDTHVPVTPDLEKSTYTGSTLWVDNLSLTY